MLKQPLLNPKIVHLGPETWHANGSCKCWFNPSCQLFILGLIQMYTAVRTRIKVTVEVSVCTDLMITQAQLVAPDAPRALV